MKTKNYVFAALAIALMALIFYVSSSSGFSVGIPSPWDKLIHASVFGMLAWLWRQSGASSLVAFALAVLYGVSDEYHQSFTPGRYSDILDLLADATGAAIAAWVIGSRTFFGLKKA